MTLKTMRALLRHVHQSRIVGAVYVLLRGTKTGTDYLPFKKSLVRRTGKNRYITRSRKVLLKTVKRDQNRKSQYT